MTIFRIFGTCLCILVVLSISIVAQPVETQGGTLSAEDVWIRFDDGDLLSDMYKVVTNGHYAYCLMNMGMQVIDFSDPSHPVKVDELSLPWMGYSRMMLVGSYLYVGTRLYDVSTPSTPVYVGQSSVTPNKGVFATYQNYLYYLVQRTDAISDLAPSLVAIYDMTDPSQLNLVSTWAVQGALGDELVFDLDVEGDNLFLAGSLHSSLLIADLADPLHPQIVGYTDRIASGQEVDVQGNTACVVSEAKATGYDYMLIYDVTDKANPVFMTSYGNEPIRKVLFRGTLAHLLYVQSGTETVQLSDPSSPQVVGTRVNPESPVGCNGWTDLALIDTCLLGVRSCKGLEVLTLAADGAPTYRGSHQTTDYPRYVATDNQNLYVTSATTGLMVLSISNPVDPVLIGTLPIPEAERVATRSDFVYVSSSGSPNVSIVDVADPSAPLLVGQLATSDKVRDVVVAEDLLLVTDVVTGLYVYSIANPATPALLSFVPMSTCYRVAYANHYAVATAWSNGAKVLDLTDPSHPIVAATITAPGEALGAVAYDGRYAYISGTGLVIYDLQDLSDIHIEGRSSVNPDFGKFSDAVLDGDYLFSTEQLGVMSFNAIDRVNPSLACWSSSPGRISGIAKNDSLLYVTNSYSLATYQYTKCCQGMTGDLDMSGNCDLKDLSILIQFVLTGSRSGDPLCKTSANINNAGGYDISDLSYLIAYLIKTIPSLPACR